MDELVERLSSGDHAVEVFLRPEPSLERFREALERGYVHVKFVETRGGTELGVRLDSDASDLSTGDLTTGEGSVRLVGQLKLNWVPVRCIADIDVASLKGKGRLEILEEAEAGSSTGHDA